MKVRQAIERIAGILPIKKHLDQLDQGAAGTYHAILRGFFELGRAPTLVQLIEQHQDAAQHVVTLSGLDMITLDESGEIRGCYPFTMEQRVHRIQINGHQVHAMCALDALAPGAMFRCRSTVDSECAVTAEPVHIELDNQQVLNHSSVRDLHFGINWMAASGCCSCADSLCTEMLFLKDHQVAEQWLQEDAENRQIFDLIEAIAFSSGLFKPMMRQG
jgi:alkylmercury lyase